MPEYRLRAGVIHPNEGGPFDGSRTFGSFGSERDALRALANLRDTTYEGWANYQSWAVALWINNEQSTQEAAREVATSTLGQPREVEESALRDFVEDVMLDRYYDRPSLAADLLGNTLAHVDWAGILEGLREE